MGRRPRKYTERMMALKRGQSVVLATRWRVGCILVQQYGRSLGRVFHVEPAGATALCPEAEMIKITRVA